MNTMDQLRLKGKISEARDEFSQTVFAFSEYANGPLKRAERFLHDDKDESEEKIKDGHRAMDQVLLEELSEVIEKCIFIRNTIVPHAQDAPCPTSRRRSNSSLCEILQDFNPSITNDMGSDGPQAANTLDEQTRPKVPYTPDLCRSPDSDTLATTLDEQTRPKVPYTPDLCRSPDSDTLATEAQPDDDILPPPYSSHAYIGQTFNELFSVKLGHSGPLKKGYYRNKLNSLMTVFAPSSIFDKEETVFKPSCVGVYALNVEVCQGGQGEMDVWLRRHGHLSYVGKTNGNMMETSVMKVKALIKGQDHWVEVRVLKGEPSVHWCNFSGFLIATNPSPESLSPSN